MKKLLFLLPIVMLSLLMSSCKGDDGSMGPAGPPGVGYYLAGYKEILPNQWEAFGKDDGGQYFEYEFPVKELDKEVFDNGVVNTFIEIDGEKYQLNKTLAQYKQNGDFDYYIRYDYSYVQGCIIFRMSFSDIDMIPIDMVPGDKQLFYFVLQALQ